MDELSEADKYLLYGLLLKRRRSRVQDKKVMAIIRSAMDLNAKIKAIMDLHMKGSPLLTLDSGAGARGLTRGALGPTRSKTSGSALVIDVRPEITKLLKKCSLKRELSFLRIGERFDAIPLLRMLRTKLIVVNESLSPEDCLRYFEICRAIEPNIRIIYLSAPPRQSALPERATRFLPKPLNIERLEEAARNLLDMKG